MARFIEKLFVLILKLAGDFFLILVLGKLKIIMLEVFLIFTGIYITLLNISAVSKKKILPPLNKFLAMGLTILKTNFDYLSQKLLKASQFYRTICCI